MSAVLVDDDDDDDRYHVHRKHAFNEAAKGNEKAKKERKTGAKEKSAREKVSEVLTQGIGLFSFSPALQGWFIDKVMVP